MTKTKERWPFRGVLRWDADKGKFVKLKERPKVIEAPFVITDEIPETETMVDNSGRKFTSKAKLREYMHEHNRRYGTNYIETGGERAKPEPPKRATYQEIREDVEKAYYDVKYARVPISEQERELCNREEREFQEYAKRQK